MQRTLSNETPLHIPGKRTNISPGPLRGQHGHSHHSFHLVCQYCLRLARHSRTLPPRDYDHSSVSRMPFLVLVPTSVHLMFAVHHHLHPNFAHSVVSSNYLVFTCLHVSLCAFAEGILPYRIRFQSTDIRRCKVRCGRAATKALTGSCFFQSLALTGCFFRTTGLVATLHAAAVGGVSGAFDIAC